MNIGYYACITNQHDVFESIYWYSGDAVYKFYEGKLFIVGTDLDDAAYVEITEEEAFKWAHVSERVFDTEYNKKIMDYEKVQLKVFNKALKERACERRHQRNLLKKKQR